MLGQTFTLIDFIRRKRKGGGKKKIWKRLKWIYGSARLSLLREDGGDDIWNTKSRGRKFWQKWYWKWSELRRQLGQAKVRLRFLSIDEVAGFQFHWDSCLISSPLLSSLRSLSVSKSTFILFWKLPPCLFCRRRVSSVPGFELFTWNTGMVILQATKDDLVFKKVQATNVTGS